MEVRVPKLGYHMVRIPPLVVFLLVFAIIPFAAAQTSAPATLPQRHALVVPPGFTVVEIEGRNYVLQQPDEAWVRESLKNLKPTTLPTTMPSTLIDRVTAEQDNLKKQIARDLALIDSAPIDTFFKGTVLHSLQMYDSASPPLFYMVTSEAKLKELILGGWTDPRFYYNRAADRVEVNWQFNMAVDRPADDAIIPVVYGPNDKDDAKHRMLTDAIGNSESELARSIALRAMVDLRGGLIDFVLGQTIQPVLKKSDCEWFPAGVAAVLASRYTATLTGLSLEGLLHDVSDDDPRIPMRQSAIDLINPLPREQMNPQAAPLYIGVYRRKAARVVNIWLTAAGDEALPKVLAELRKNPPENGTAMVQMIKQISGAPIDANLGLGK